MDPLAVYVHLPFCARKCAYCDFNSRPAAPGEAARYLEALQAELKARPPAPASTVYFGGGTPTLYPPADLARVLEAVAEHFALSAATCAGARSSDGTRDASPSPDGHGVSRPHATGPRASHPAPEISVEANPGTVTAQSLRELRAAGFNRLSLGVQSFDDAELALLGRIHSADDARRAMRDARSAGFDDLSIDLIRGLPGQTPAAWEANLRQAIALSPDHISAYGLSLEHGTPLADRVAAGELARPASDDPEWVRLTVELLASAGYERYEVSNFARPGHACRHNLAYWHNRPYLGLGAGAWSYEIGARGAVRYRNEPDIAGFCDAALRGEDLVSERDPQDLQVAAAEALMVGLRLAEGVSIEEIHQRFGIELRARHGALVRHLVAAGLMLDDGVALRLTFEGMLVQSAVAARFLPDG